MHQLSIFWEGPVNRLSNLSAPKFLINFPVLASLIFLKSIEAYDNYVKLLIKTNCIDNAKKIWWDLRVHPFFNTVEFRVCDIPMTVQETISIAALFQGICAKLYKLRMQNLNFMMYSRALLNENKWRASRYGIDGSLIDFGKESEVNTRVLLYELLDFIDDVVPHLGSRHAVNNVHKNDGTRHGADRQLKVFEESKNLVNVVDYIHDSFLSGL